MNNAGVNDKKYNFGHLIDTARAKPVTVVKYGRAVVVVVAVEDYERLKALESRVSAPSRETGKRN